MRKPETIVEGSEQHTLLTKGGTHKIPFPTPREFQEKAYVFCDYLSDAVEPLKVERIDNNTVAQIEAYLHGNDDRCVWLMDGPGLATQLDFLFDSP